MRISSKAKKEAEGEIQPEKKVEIKKRNQPLWGSALCLAAHGCPSRKSSWFCIQTGTHIPPDVLCLSHTRVLLLCCSVRAQVRRSETVLNLNNPLLRVTFPPLFPVLLQFCFVWDVLAPPTLTGVTHFYSSTSSEALKG